MDMQKVIKYKSWPRGSSRVQNPGGRRGGGGCWCLELTDALPLIVVVRDALFSLANS